MLLLLLLSHALAVALVDDGVVADGAADAVAAVALLVHTLSLSLSLSPPLSRPAPELRGFSKYKPTS